MTLKAIEYRGVVHRLWSFWLFGTRIQLTVSRP